MLRILPLALLAAILACAPANAATRGERAAALAEQVWHLAPGSVTVDEVGPRPPSVANSACGWSYERVPTVHVVPACPLMRYWPVFCSTVLHEAGHIAGFRDPLNPSDPYHSHLFRSVMYARPLYGLNTGRIGSHGRRIVTVSGTDRRCATRGSPTSRRRMPGSARRARRR